MKKTYLLILLTLVITSCKERKANVIPNLKNKVVKMWYETQFDTLKINQGHELSIKFINSLDFSNYETEEYGFKILDGCIIFTKNDRVEFHKENFDSKCDSIFSKSTKIKDTFSLDFVLTPKKLGKSSYLLKLKETIYFKPHKDSIRKIVNEYFLEEDYFVKK